jgi:hypothetical protein
MQFTVTEVLQQHNYDGPALVYGHSEAGSVLALICDADIKHTFWLAVVVSSTVLDGVLANEITLRDAFETHRIGHAWTGADIGYAGSEATLLPLDDPSLEWLPKGYLRRDSEND